MSELVEQVIAPNSAGSGSDLAARPGRPTSADPSMADRVKALTALISALSVSARQAGIGAFAAGRWLADEVSELAPTLAFRNAASLRRQYPELSDLEIAERLVASARRTTAAIGAAAGAVAAIEFAAPPMLLAAPVQIAAETIAVTAVELRLVAELHEIMGFAPPGPMGDRATAYLMAWVRRRAVSASSETAGMSTMLSAAAKKELRGRLMRRLGRSSTSLAPFLAGAAAGAEINRRATKQLGEVLLKELRTMHSDTWFRRVTEGG